MKSRFPAQSLHVVDANQQLPIHLPDPNAILGVLAACSGAGC